MSFRSFDLSKEVLWVSVLGQTVAELQAVKVEGLKKILLLGLPRTTQVCLGSSFEQWAHQQSFPDHYAAS